jgi:hypothetical protein
VGLAGQLEVNGQEERMGHEMMGFNTLILKEIEERLTEKVNRPSRKPDPEQRRGSTSRKRERKILAAGSG